MAFKYRKEMYNAIIDTLNDEGQNFNTIYDKSKQNLRQISSYPRDYSPSKTLFSKHLEQMVKDNIVKREQQDTKLKIKAVNYSLSDSAKIKGRLKILGLDEKQASLMKIYERFLFYEAFHKRDRIISSEQELDRFLSKFNLKSKDIVWARTVTEENMAVNDLIYGDRVGRNLSSEPERQKFVYEYWKERQEGESAVPEQIKFCTYLKANNHNPPITKPNYFERELLITKTDYWRINRYSKNIKYATDYRYSLEGFTLEEFLGNEALASEFKPRDVEEALSLFKENGLIKLKAVLPDEIRYVIADEDLAGFLKSLAFLHEEELDRLFFKWYLVEGPTLKEEEAIICLLGEKEATRIFRDAEIMSRHENKRVLKECKNAKEYNEYLKNRYCLTTWNCFIYDSILEEYEEGRKKIRRTEKQPNDDVLKYSKYFKEELKKELDRLIEVDVQKHLEEVRYDYNNILKKYDFLRDIMKGVCIKMFEPPNRELQSKVIEYKKACYDHWRHSIYSS